MIEDPLSLSRLVSQERMLTGNKERVRRYLFVQKWGEGKGRIHLLLTVLFQRRPVVHLLSQM